MFLRIKRRRGLEYLVLVENYRRDTRVLQRTQHNFGRLDRVDIQEVNRILVNKPGFAFLKDRVEAVRGAPRGAHTDDDSAAPC